MRPYISSRNPHCTLHLGSMVHVHSFLSPIVFFHLVLPWQNNTTTRIRPKRGSNTTLKRPLRPCISSRNPHCTVHLGSLVHLHSYLDSIVFLPLILSWQNKAAIHPTRGSAQIQHTKDRCDHAGITGSIVLNKLLMLDNILNVLPRSVRGRRLGTAIVKTVTHTQTR
jgi:hypothetical protein